MSAYPDMLLLAATAAPTQGDTVKIRRNRTAAPVIATTRRDVDGDIVEVTFTDGVTAVRIGARGYTNYWTAPDSWGVAVPVLPAAHHDVVSAL